MQHALLPVKWVQEETMGHICHLGKITTLSVDFFLHYTHNTIYMELHALGLVTQSHLELQINFMTFNRDYGD